MQVNIDPEELIPIIRATVEATLARIRDEEQQLGDLMAVDETGAARFIGLERHQLRDERARGRIGFSQIVGRRIRYTKSDLLEYLARNRTEARNV
jgi:Helix-turn-helix domain